MESTPCISLARSRRRTSLAPRRGAVLVEAVIAIAMMMVMFAGALFLHRLYVKKLASIQTARQQAWASAMPGCGGGALGGLAPAQWLGSLATGQVGDLPSSTNPGLLAVGTGDATPVSESVSASPLLGGRSYSVTTTTRFACNEVPQQFDDIASLGQWIAQLFIPGVP
jgi:hypothetical protein